LTAAAAFGTAGILERRSARAQDVVVSGSPQPKYAEFDNVTVQFMVDNAITAGQLAFGRGGKVVFSHAYGAASLAMRVHTTSIFRVASVSKAFTAAALWTLQRKGAFTMDTPLFPYLGIRSVLLPSQKPDSRIDRITIGQAAAHTAGLAPSGEGDPEFEYRKIETQSTLPDRSRNCSSHGIYTDYRWLPAPERRTHIRTSGISCWAA
jgi:CubicO group peptidase (beta-lactamase class C family)